MKVVDGGTDEHTADETDVTLETIIDTGDDGELDENLNIVTTDDEDDDKDDAD